MDYDFEAMKLEAVRAILQLQELFNERFNAGELTNKDIASLEESLTEMERLVAPMRKKAE